MRGRRGPVLVVLALVGVLVLAALLTPDRTDSFVPYDPSSTGPDGTRALTELLAAYDADVAIPDRLDLDGADVVLVLYEPNVVDLDEDDGGSGVDVAAELRDWAAGGGTLVVADPFSELTPRTSDAGGPFGPVELGPEVCDLEAVEPVGPITDDGAYYRRASDDVGCYGDAEQAFLVSSPVGRGRIVSLGGAAPFTNAELGDLGNAELAVSLLTPEDGLRVVVLRPDVFVGGGETCAPLDANCVVATVLGPGGRLAVLTAVVALVVYGWARGRRLGRPVAEPRPTEIAASELVDASGQLLSQTATPREVADLLRRDLRSELGRRLGLPADVPPEVLIEAVADRTPLDPHTVARALGDHDVATDVELVELGALIDLVREEVLHEHAR